MIPVKQTIIDKGRGNCFATCIASILEMPLEQVPNFRETHECNFIGANQWLVQFGLALVKMAYFNGECICAWETACRLPYGTVCILSGESPRGKGIGHAVVGVSAGAEFKIVHDPHPSRDGLVNIESIYFFAAINPANKIQIIK